MSLPDLSGPLKLIIIIMALVSDEFKIHLGPAAGIHVAILEPS